MLVKTVFAHTRQNIEAKIEYEKDDRWVQNSDIEAARNGYYVELRKLRKGEQCKQKP